MNQALFLVLDDGVTLYTHHLPLGLGSASVLASAFSLGCRLVVTFASSCCAKTNKNAKNKNERKEELG